MRRSRLWPGRLDRRPGTRVGSGSYCYAEAYGLGGLHDRSGCEDGLMTACTALIALEPPAIDQPMLAAIATRTPERIGPAGHLQSSLTLRIGTVEPLELRRGEAVLELDGTV